MRIYLRELSDQDQELDFTQQEKWVSEAVERVDERLEESPSFAQSKTRNIQVHFSLRKVDNVVVVSGHAETRIRLLCSRCANTFEFDCHPHFSGLYCQDPVMAGVGHLAQEGKPAGQTKGFARHAHDSDADEEVAEGRDLDITYLSEDYIDLGDVLSEQLRLQIPFQPLCKEDCKGICFQCGADLNVGRCACAKLKKATPFAVLQNFKV